MLPPLLHHLEPPGHEGLDDALSGLEALEDAVNTPNGEVLGVAADEAELLVELLLAEGRRAARHLHDELEAVLGRAVLVVLDELAVLELVEAVLVLVEVGADRQLGDLDGRAVDHLELAGDDHLAGLRVALDGAVEAVEPGKERAVLELPAAESRQAGIAYLGRVVAHDEARVAGAGALGAVDEDHRQQRGVGPRLDLLAVDLMVLEDGVVGLREEGAEPGRELGLDVPVGGGLGRQARTELAFGHEEVEVVGAGVAVGHADDGRGHRAGAVVVVGGRRDDRRQALHLDEAGGFTTGQRAVDRLALRRLEAIGQEGNRPDVVVERELLEGGAEECAHRDAAGMDFTVRGRGLSFHECIVSRRVGGVLRKL